MAMRAKCDKYTDCFANGSKRCVSLKDNDFGGRGSPFYKNGAETGLDRINMVCGAYASLHSFNKEAKGERL